MAITLNGTTGITTPDIDSTTYGGTFSETGTYLRMASGTGGIQFNGDTAAANALDDYEEGTWTPTTSSLGNISSVTISSAAYTKIGRVVHCRMYGTVAVTSTGTNTYFGFSLPFTADNNATQPAGVGNMAGAQNSTFVVIDWSGGNTTEFGVWAQSGNVVNNGTLAIGIGFTYTAA